jgi:hypothetical protein
MAVERDGTLELIPLRQCLWCLSADHMLEKCPEKHNLFALTFHDEIFLTQVGIALPFGRHIDLDERIWCDDPELYPHELELSQLDCVFLQACGVGTR